MQIVRYLEFLCSIYLCRSVKLQTNSYSHARSNSYSGTNTYPRLQIQSLRYMLVLII